MIGKRGSAGPWAGLLGTAALVLTLAGCPHMPETVLGVAADQGTILRGAPSAAHAPSAASQDTTHQGDIVIATARDAARWDMLETLRGNLTITDATLETIRLPRLARVQGNVLVSYPRGSEHAGITRAFEAPVLEHIDGDLVLASHGSEAQNLEASLGLDALRELTGELVIDLQAFNVTVSGLSRLETVSDLQLITGAGDLSAVRLLPALTQVSGDVSVSAGNGLFSVLRALERVNGDFALDGGRLTNTAFDRLTSIAGDASLSSVFMSVSPHSFVLRSLAQVGGMLLVARGGKEDLRLGAASGLSVHALVVDHNVRLESLEASHVRVSSSGRVTITDNTRLCTSRARDFVAGLHGFRGTTTIRGNAGC